MITSVNLPTTAPTAPKITFSALAPLSVLVKYDTNEVTTNTNAPIPVAITAPFKVPIAPMAVFAPDTNPFMADTPPLVNVSSDLAPLLMVSSRFLAATSVSSMPFLTLSVAFTASFESTLIFITFSVAMLLLSAPLLDACC